jgi:O-antigen ligase
LKNALPFMAFFALWSVFEERPSLIPLAHWSYIAASLFVLITVLSDSGYRAGGVLQVNYAAHFLGVGLLLTLYLPIKLPFRVVLAGALFVGILQTGSFGGLALLAGFVAYWLWTRQDLVAGNSRFVIRALIVLAIAVLVPIAEVRLGESGLGVGSGFESDRYERSSDGRREMFERGVQSAIKNPWGVGPGQYRDITDSGGTPEMHNDALNFLLENGLIGLIGIVGIIWKIAGSTSQGGLARIMLTGLILSSFGRQTWNFRHAWVALAIAIALDQAQRVSRNQNARTAASKDLR